MRRVLRFMFVMACLGPPSAWASDMPSAPGTYRQTLNTETVKDLRFSLHLPPGSPSQTPVPLVVALHYGGQITPWFGGRFLSVLVEPGLRDLGAIIIAPDCPSSEGWANPKAEAAILELMRAIRHAYPIDEKKILLTGFSMGGIGTWYLAARHPGLFSAAIPMSAIPGPDALDRFSDTPLLAIHGKDDELFPYRKLETIIRTLKSEGHPVRLQIIDGLSHYQAGAFVKHLQAAIPWIRGTWTGKNPIP